MHPIVATGQQWSSIVTAMKDATTVCNHRINMHERYKPEPQRAAVLINLAITPYLSSNEQQP